VPSRERSARRESSVGADDEGLRTVKSAPSPTPLVIITLGLLTAIGPFSLDAYLPALPAMAVDLGVSAPAIQFSLTACLLGLGFGQLIAGPLGDRYGRRRPILIGIGLYTLASLGCAFAPNAEVLIILRAVQGLAGAAGVVLARATVQDISSDTSATRLYSQMAVISGVAPVIAPVIGAAVFGAFGWRAVFMMLAGIGLVLLIIVLLVLAETHPVDRRRSAHPVDVFRAFAALLRDGGFRGFVLISAFMAATLFTYISSSPFVIQEVFGLGELAFALIFAANGLGLSIAGMINARIVHRVNPARILRVASAVQVFGVVALATTVALNVFAEFASPVALVVSLLVAMVPLGFILPTATSFAMARSGERAGSASALLGVGTFFIGGLVSPLSGLGNPALIMAALLLATATIGLFLVYRATRPLI
jgi:DHA1 family bicyclomycin/chloramphenicol resistance-like MFS transporter